jgi:hypothetical protein
MLCISKWRLQVIETSRRPAPSQIADRFETLVRGLDAGAVKSDNDKSRRQYRDFRRSINFSETPPFLIPPDCPCMDKRCRLTPKGDGDWDERHLWKFMGRRCTKIYYVDSSGKVVPRPVRHSSPSSPLDDFHRSIHFSVVPPFANLPPCPCGNRRCRLLPRKDRDVDGQHFWGFKGWRCQRVSYLDSQRNGRTDTSRIEAGSTTARPSSTEALQRLRKNALSQSAIPPNARMLRRSLVLRA